MSPHHDRFADNPGPTAAPGEVDDNALDNAAEALREVEIEAVKPENADAAAISSDTLERMSIDDLRRLAAKLDVPNRGAIIERDQLIAAIRERQ